MTTDTRIADWDSYSAGLRARGKELTELHPELMKGFGALNRAASSTQHLDAKTLEFIALAVAVTTRCQAALTPMPARPRPQARRRRRSPKRLASRCAQCGRGADLFDACAGRY
jgi:hypothetical protein